MRESGRKMGRRENNANKTKMSQNKRSKHFAMVR